jgi:hypothetical protein
MNNTGCFGKSIVAMEKQWMLWNWTGQTLTRAFSELYVRKISA